MEKMAPIDDDDDDNETEPDEDEDDPNFLYMAQ
jgi:hypothetical protein